MSSTEDLQNRILKFFDRPLVRIEMAIDVAKHIDRIAFVDLEGKRLALENYMIDIDERFEEGSIHLTDEVSEAENQVKFDFENICVDKKSVRFLRRKEGKCPVLSGIEFRFVGEEGDNLIIVGAAPCTLVFFSNLYAETRMPEYPLSNYKCV